MLKEAASLWRRIGSRSVPRWVPHAFIASVFVLSRVIYWVKGVAFDTTPITEFSQLLDPPLLEHHLLESVFYLHAQPPLYNLLTGLALKISEHAPGRVLAPFFLLCSAYMVSCLYYVLRRLRVPGAALIAAAMVASPAWALYEHWCFYPHLNVTWLAGAVAWLAASRGRAGRAMLIAAAHVAGLVLTRSLFHPLFLVLFAVVVVASVERGERVRALVCWLLPGVLVAALCAKNLVLFGFAGTSSWASRNLCHTVADVLGPARIKRVEKRLRLTPAIHTAWFENGDRNVQIFKLRPKRTGIPALDQVLKSTPPHLTNFNHWSYPATQERYARDALRLTLHYPRQYVLGVLATTVPTFFLPVDYGFFFEANRAKIPRASRWFDRFERSLAVRALLAAGLCLAVLRASSRSCRRGERAVILTMLLTIAWVCLVGLVGENGENYRFRYKILWISWVLASSGLVLVTRRVSVALRRAARSRRVPPEPRGSPPV